MKLPVFKAYAATFAYLTQHFADLVKALWLPSLLMLGTQFYLMPGYYDAMIEVTRMGESADPAEVMKVMGPAMQSMGLMFLSMLIFYPMLVVASLRHVVRGDELKLPFYLGFGGDELRIIGGYLLLILMVGLAFGVGMLAVTVLAAALAAAAPQFGAAIGAMSMVVFLAAIIWFMMRMSLIFPAAVGTRTVGLAQSWRVTKGNSLNLLVFWGLVVVLFFGIAIIYVVAVIPSLWPLYVELFKNAADEAAQQDISIRMIEAQRDMMDPSKASFWPYAVATYVMMIAQMAIMGAAGGVAWRYVSGSEREAA